MFRCRLSNKQKQQRRQNRKETANKQHKHHDQQNNNSNNCTIDCIITQQIYLQDPPNTCPSSLPHKQNRIKYNILYATTESEKDKQQQNVLELLHMRKQI